MVKKSLVFLLICLVAVFMVVSSALASKAGVAANGSTSGSYYRSIQERAQIVGGADEGDAIFSGESMGWEETATYGDSRAFLGLQIGITWYDYQHNGTMGRQIAMDVDGRIIFSWMHQPSELGARDVYYNSLMNGVLAYPAGGCRYSGAKRAGYTTCDQWHGYAFIAWHENQATTANIVSWCGVELGHGAGCPPASSEAPHAVAGHHSSAGSDLDGYIWPVLHVDSEPCSDEPLTHMVSNEADVPENQTSLIYYRGAGIPPNFGADGMFVDSVECITSVVRQDPNSDKVAIVYNASIFDAQGETYQVVNDVVYYESTDKGLTWGPQHNITNYQDTDLERAYTEVAAMYDHAGCLHIIWNTHWYDEAAGLWSKYDARLRHWDDCNDCISLVATNIWEVAHCDPGVWNTVLCKINISECLDVSTSDYRLYATYTFFPGEGDASAAGFCNGEIYASASSTAGLTWGPPVNLTNTNSDGCAAGACESEHWSSSLMYTTDSLRIFYVGDTDAGGWAGGGTQGEATPQQCPMMFHSVECFLMDSYVELSAMPNEFRDPFNVKPGQMVDTNYTVSNGGNIPADYTIDIDYISGLNWASVTPGGAGSIPAGCVNSADFGLHCTGPSPGEDLFQCNIRFNYSTKTLLIPVDLYCFEDFFVPELVSIRTAHNELNVSQASLVAHQEVGHMFSWFSDGADFLYDGSLVIGNSRTNMNFLIFYGGSEATSTNPKKELRALSHTDYDSTTYPSYRYAQGVGCIEDSTIAFTSKYYAPKHVDSSGFYIAHFDLYAGPHWVAPVTDVAIAFAADWDIPDDSSGSDNKGYVDETRQLVYQQGQWTGSPDYNDCKYGGLAYRGDDAANEKALGGWVWLNDMYVYPNSGYHVDSLAKYLINSPPGWTVFHPDSTEDANAIIHCDNGVTIGADDTVSFSIIICGSNDQTPKSLAKLQEAVTKGAQFICDHVAPDAPHCAGWECKCGDADNNDLWNIADVVYLISYIFGGGPLPVRECLGDADGNCLVNIADVVFLISYIFGGGPEPYCPANPTDPGCYQWK